MCKKVIRIVVRVCTCVWAVSTGVRAGELQTAEGTAAKQDRVEGVVTRSNKDKSTGCSE